MANETDPRTITTPITTDTHPDPITGAPGAHPVGTGVGATGGALAGAAVGAMAGPVGAAVGLVAGAVMGGLGGKAAAEGVNPTAEDTHWRENYDREPYYEAGRSYDDYRPAYEMGWSGRVAGDADFDTAEPALSSEWNRRRGSSSLDWSQARHASRAAWDRAGRSAQSGTTSSTTTTDGSSSGLGTTSSPMGRTDSSASTGMGTTSNNMAATSDALGTPGGSMSTGVGTTAATLGAATTTASTDPLDDEDTLDVLNDLLGNTRDGEEGFRSCAEEVRSSDLKQVFSERAGQCRQAAQELAELIRRNGGTPAEGGTAAGALHRGWVHVKGAIGANSDESILEECERGEDAAVARYRKALKQSLPADVRGVIERQAQGAQRNHDQIKALRNQARASGA
ncbi:MAG: hypothetical protein JWQ03_666 [Variovorax sp.]|nr:hypothetical protein [Variovorax sp.]